VHHSHQLLAVDDYFVAPYSGLRATYRDSAGQDRELEWLALLRVGRFYVDCGDTLKATPIRREVSDGLTNTLGAQHPLTLVARTDLGLGLTSEGRYKEAYAELKSVADAANNVLGTNNPELYRIINSKGIVELYLGLFSKSAVTIKTAAEGSLKLSDPSNNQDLTKWMWSAIPLIYLGELDEALPRLESVFKKRRGKYGPIDLANTATQFLIGTVYRRRGNRAESLANLREALAVRLRDFPLSNMWSMDPAIELLVAYWDFGATAEAHQLLADLDSHGQVDCLFNRQCQVTHMRASLQWQAGRRSSAIDLLQGLVIQTGRDQYNRALLWATLDLAKMLRRRGAKGDEAQASANFDGVLVDRRLQRTRAADLDEYAAEKPNPPRLLRLAEEALTLVRGRRFAEVDELMRREEVGWYREQDLWLWFNASTAADTTWVRSPVENL